LGGERSDSQTYYLSESYRCLPHSRLRGPNQDPEAGGEKKVWNATRRGGRNAGKNRSLRCFFFLGARQRVSAASMGPQHAREQHRKPFQEYQEEGRTVGKEGGTGRTLTSPSPLLRRRIQKDVRGKKTKPLGKGKVIQALFLSTPALRNARIGLEPVGVNRRRAEEKDDAQEKRLPSSVFDD